MPEKHIRQPAALGKLGFIYNACRPFTKNKERIQKKSILVFDNPFRLCKVKDFYN